MKLILTLFALCFFFNSFAEVQKKEAKDIFKAAQEGFDESDHVGEVPCEECKSNESFAPFSNQKVCQHYSKFRKAGVPSKPLRQALSFYQRNQNKFQKDRYISIADYSIHSTKKRFFVLDLETGNVKSYQVSHGSGKFKIKDYKGPKVKNSKGKLVTRVVKQSMYGDSNRADGIPNRCEVGQDVVDKYNQLAKKYGQGPGRNASFHKRYAMTRPGFYSTANLDYSAAHPTSWPKLVKGKNINKLVLNGLSDGVNDDALNKGVVMHGANYNYPGSNMGRSFGCPAFTPADAPKVINLIKEGSLYYSYVPSCPKDMKAVEKQVPDWESMCQ